MILPGSSASAAKRQVGAIGIDGAENAQAGRQGTIYGIVNSIIIRVIREAIAEIAADITGKCFITCSGSIWQKGA